MIPMLIIQKKKADSLFPNIYKYLYNARPHIQGAHLETNHPYNNYSPHGMSKKGSLFTSANVAPGDQLSTQFEI